MLPKRVRSRAKALSFHPPASAHHEFRLDAGHLELLIFYISPIPTLRGNPTRNHSSWYAPYLLANTRHQSLAFNETKCHTTARDPAIITTSRTCANTNLNSRTEKTIPSPKSARPPRSRSQPMPPAARARCPSLRRSRAFSSSLSSMTVLPAVSARLPRPSTVVRHTCVS
jgi:hypothetical protein